MASLLHLSHHRRVTSCVFDVMPASVAPLRAVTLPSLSLTLADLEQSAVKLARELGIRSGKVSRVHLCALTICSLFWVRHLYLYMSYAVAAGRVLYC